MAAASAAAYARRVAVRILGVNGSIRDGSSADRALRFVIDLLTQDGAQCEAFEIGTLPLLDGRPDGDYPAIAGAWRAAAEAAEGLVLTVPTYHGAAPGALKNALDFLDVPQIAGKPFALIGIAGGDAEPGVTDIARVLRHIGGIAAVPDVVISRSADHWGAGDQPSNKSVAIALAKVASDLMTLCGLAAEGKLPQP